jgi:ATP-dependent DNA ligase
VNGAVHAGQWHRLEFRPFDVVSAGVSFEQAREIMATLALPSHVRPVEWRNVRSAKEAIAIAASIQADGGEGAMVRRPGSSYTPGRTAALLKMK